MPAKRRARGTFSRKFAVGRDVSVGSSLMKGEERRGREGIGWWE